MRIPLAPWLAAAVSLCLFACSGSEQASNTPAKTDPQGKVAPMTPGNPADAAPAKPEAKPAVKPAKIVAEPDEFVPVSKDQVNATNKQPAATGQAVGPNPLVLTAIQTLMAKPEQPDASIEVQHCLIAFQGSGVDSATRSKEQAEGLAHQLYLQAIGGADFDALVKANTNDSHPGKYTMDGSTRKGMVQAFGDVGWRLKVGEIGLAPYDAKTSPFGWHIIKRIR